jgi:hypothetical protein
MRMASLRRGETGQASVELAAAGAASALAALVAFQLLAAGYSAVMADHAAEAAAIAMVNGRGPERAAQEAVPGWPRRLLDVRRHGGRVEVTLVAPTPIAFLGERLSFSSEAVVRERRQ